ncbi:MAG: DUF4255 domain-containing protein [Polyangiaceae bacterium]|nr:DUF4255 domain-containing protein [Polyangiaceae bacterium]
MSAIATTLRLIRDKLNEQFKAADPSYPDDWVILSNIINPDGSEAERTADKIVMTLAGIEQDTTVATWNRTVPSGSNQFGIVTPAVNVNLLVLFYANFYGKNYEMGLRLIAGTISFFQQNPWFNHASLVGLDPVIDKIAIELNNLDTTQTNYLVGMMGAKYLPTVLYKLRMIPFRADTITGFVPAAQGARGSAEAPLPLDGRDVPRPFPDRNVEANPLARKR